MREPIWQQQLGGLEDRAGRQAALAAAAAALELSSLQVSAIGAISCRSRIRLWVPAHSRFSVDLTEDPVVGRCMAPDVAVKELKETAGP